MKLKTILQKSITYIFIAILITILLFGLFFLILGADAQSFYYSVFPKQCSVTSDPIVIESSAYNHANNLQPNANVWMGTYDGKLFFHPCYYFDASEQTRYYNYLSVFDNSGATRLVKLDGGIVGIEDSYVYWSAFSIDGELIQNEGVYCYHIQSQKTTQLSREWSHGFVASDGSICFVSGSDNTVAKYTQGESIGTASIGENEYTLGGIVYTVEGIAGSQTIVATDSSGVCTDLSKFIPRGHMNLFNCNQGLVVHNAREGGTLYLICPEGNVVTLFEADCYTARSAVNRHGDWVFLSFLRYRYSEELDASVPYENDELSGTYRISLLDYSYEKISNQIYTGLYIFDDSGIYACDNNCHIYKLDFNGNITQILLE